MLASRHRSGLPIQNTRADPISKNVNPGSIIADWNSSCRYRATSRASWGCAKRGKWDVERLIEKGNRHFSSSLRCDNEADRARLFNELQFLPGCRRNDRDSSSLHRESLGKKGKWDMGEEEKMAEWRWFASVRSPQLLPDVSNRPWFH